jgi:hypothetical protein
MTEDMFAAFVMLGLIPAFIASRKGHPFVFWWIYGWLLFIVALPHAIFVRDRYRRPCPTCRESIKADASVCHYCGRGVYPIPGGLSD